MTGATRRRRAAERGLLRGCCAGVVALVVVGVAALVLLARLTGTPELGPPPSGPDDGASPLAIAATLAVQAGKELAQPGSTGAAVLVSEEDLSTLAAADNPAPQELAALQARARGDQLWVTAQSHLGPLGVVVTAKLGLGFHPGAPVTATVQEIDVGDQQVPGFISSAVDPAAGAPFSLTPLLIGTGLSVFGLECVVVVPDRGVELGFHPPLARPSTGYCAAHPLPPDLSAG